MPDPRVRDLLRLADGALILAQRLSEWCGHGPVLEEDIALTNIALDLLGQARALYSHAGALEGAGRTEDDFAYWRDARDFMNPVLAELPNGDFAQSVLRAYFYVAYQHCLWPQLSQTPDAELARIARKSVPETTYHRAHLAQWVIRLGDGTPESHTRMKRALEYLWPYTIELFAENLASTLHPHASLAPEWLREVSAVLAEAMLGEPPSVPLSARDHTEHLEILLAEMQSFARAHPGAKW